MTWFDEASDAAPGQAPLPERQRSRRVLVAWLLGGGVLVGLLVAGAVSAVARFIDDQNASRPPAALAALDCGDPVPAADTEALVTLQVQMLDARVRPTYASGSETDVIAALVNAGEEVTVRAESDLVVVAVRDGVVAGAPAAVDLRDPDARRDDPYLMAVSQGIGVTADLTYPLVGCDDRPLAAGEYTLVAGVRVAVAGADPTELVGESFPFGVD